MAEEKEKKKEAPAKGKKKINRLTLKELEERIEDVQKKMRGLASSYAQQLLRRKEQLLREKETRVQEKDEPAKPGGDNAT